VLKEVRAHSVEAKLPLHHDEEDGQLVGVLGFLRSFSLLHMSCSLYLERARPLADVGVDLVILLFFKKMAVQA
jgi:hypothetical protein